MTGEIAAAGDIVTGALLARSFEPGVGEGHDGPGGLCLNCGTRRQGDYCHACGQNGHVHKTLGSIGHDLLHGVFHFEGKIWRTLPMLARHPGELTRRYIDGERARFVSPLALFLFCVFLMFAMLHSTLGEFDIPATNNNFSKVAAGGIEMQIAQVRQQIAAVEQERARDKARHLPTDRLDAKRGDLKASLREMQLARDTIDPKTGDAKLTLFGGKPTGWAALDKAAAKAQANPGLMLYKLQSSAYKYSWALIPISVPFVALLFLWRRRFGLYDHAIFVTYSLCFMTLLVVAVTLAGAAGAHGPWFIVAAVFAVPLHMFAQLRGAYELRKRSALWRTMVLLFFSCLALTGWIMLLLVLGIMD